MSIPLKSKLVIKVELRLKAKDTLFEIKRVSFVNYFLVLVIRLQTGRVCLCNCNISVLLLSYLCS